MARVLCVLFVLLVALLAAAPVHATDAVVGSGTPASCTETAFDVALAAVQGSGGGTLSFQCGGVATILFAAQKTITAKVTVDGGGVITLDGGNATRHFFVSETGHLQLHGITLTQGYSGDSGGDTSGGAILNAGSLMLVQATLRGNSAYVPCCGRTATASYDPCGGGGAVVSHGPLVILDSLFEENVDENGGALALCGENGDAVVTGSTFRDNIAAARLHGRGGAILLWAGADLLVHSSDFDGNVASGAGGGLYNPEDSHVELVQGTNLRNNGAGEFGGGVYNAGTITLDRFTLSGNRVLLGFGGGIHNEGAATLINGTLSGNEAISTGGGGIGNGGTITLTNVTLSGNSTPGLGGAIYNEGAATLIHVTLSGNSARTGGGIYHDREGGQTLTLKNVLLAHGPSGGNCSEYPGSAAAITSLGFNLSSDTSCTDRLSQPGDSNNADPKLGLLALNGGPTLTHMLLPGSPAIDGGQCLAGVTTDQRGKPRPQGLACDIGAVERQPSEDRFNVWLPVLTRQLAP